jgi:hypothetical protein
MANYLEWGLPDASMSDVRVVHDATGSYADWHVKDGRLPYGDRKERYLLGKYAPSYPVPALIQTVKIMSERVRIEDDVNEIHRDFYPYTFYSIHRMWYKETDLGIVTINHVKSQDGFSYVSTIGATPKQADYAIGWQKPRYPVPAIPIEIDWCLHHYKWETPYCWAVAIFRAHTNECYGLLPD